MLLRRLLPGLVALVLVTSVAVPTQGRDDKPGDKKDTKAKTNLIWKFDFEKKTAFYQKLTTKTDQKFTVMGNVVSQNQEQTFWFKWTPEKKEGDNIILKQKVEGVKMTIDIGNQKISYDSANKNNDANPLNDFFKALTTAEFTITLDAKTNKVTKIDGYKDFVEKLGKANPTMKPLLDTILNEEALKQMVEPTFAVLPNKEVTEGDSSAEWNLGDRKLDMGPLGTYINTYKYKYVGKDPAAKTLDKIEVTMNLKYEAPKDDKQVGNLPFKIKSADLNSKEAKGTLLYNPEKGMIESSDMTLKLDGKLNIEIGGMTTEVTIDQTQTSKMETLADLPPELKAKP